MKDTFEKIYLQGKESIFVSILLIIAVIVFFVPIILILSLRGLYNFAVKLRESTRTVISSEQPLTEIIRR